MELCSKLTASRGSVSTGWAGCTAATMHTRALLPVIASFSNQVRAESLYLEDKLWSSLVSFFGNGEPWPWNLTILGQWINVHCHPYDLVFTDRQRNMLAFATGKRAHHLIVCPQDAKSSTLSTDSFLKWKIHPEMFDWVLLPERWLGLRKSRTWKSIAIGDGSKTSAACQLIGPGSKNTPLARGSCLRHQARPKAERPQCQVGSLAAPSGCKIPYSGCTCTKKNRVPICTKGFFWPNCPSKLCQTNVKSLPRHWGWYVLLPSAVLPPGHASRPARCLPGPPNTPVSRGCSWAGVSSGCHRRPSIGLSNRGKLTLMFYTGLFKEYFLKSDWCMAEFWDQWSSTILNLAGVLKQT